MGAGMDSGWDMWSRRRRREVRYREEHGGEVGQGVRGGVEG